MGCGVIAHLDVPRFDGRPLCAETDPGLFYPEKGGSTKPAKALCGLCDVRAECLAYALDRGLTASYDGIWGGTAPRERRALARRKLGRPAAKGQPMTHGTEAGYKAHRRRQEEACEACRAGALAARRRRVAAQRGAA